MRIKIPDSCVTDLPLLSLAFSEGGPSFIFFFKIFFYLFLTVLGLHCFPGFSLVAVKGGYSPVVVFRLLIAVASFVDEREF